MTTITSDRLRSYLSYDPDTGVFYHKASFFKSKNGKPIRPGWRGGYALIRIGGKTYSAHRLAWLYMTGRFPELIDHIDMNPANNKWSNLREATRSQNKANQRKRRDSSSPYKGVYWGRRQKKWGAHISFNNKRHHLGYYVSAEMAHAAYAAAAAKLHGEFARAA